MPAGIFSLGDFTIAGAATQAGTAVINLGGALAVTLEARLAVGAGGETVKAYIQTSLDQGATWTDVACLAFTTSSARKVANLSGLTPRTTPATPTSGTLTDDTCLDGVLGDRLRAVVVSTGTYTGSTVLSLRASVR